MDRREFTRSVGGHVWKSAVSVAAHTRTVHCLGANIDLLRKRNASTAAESSQRNLIVVGARNGGLGDRADSTATAFHAAIHIGRCGFTRIDLFVAESPERDHFVVSVARIEC